MTGDEAGVVEDVCEGVGGEGEGGEARFQDRGERCGGVRDRGDDQVWARGDEIGERGRMAVKGPGIGDDGDVCGGELGEGFDTVFCDGAEGIQLPETCKGERDAGLEAGNAHLWFREGWCREEGKAFLLAFALTAAVKKVCDVWGELKNLAAEHAFKRDVCGV